MTAPLAGHFVLDLTRNLADRALELLVRGPNRSRSGGRRPALGRVLPYSQLDSDAAGSIGFRVDSGIHEVSTPRCRSGV